MERLDETSRDRIVESVYKAVRQHGLEGVRVQHIAQLTGLSPGAMYRYYGSKEELMQAAFTRVDRQAAAIFEGLDFDLELITSNPAEAVRRLWTPYFRFWVARPDETVFYHRFRDGAGFRTFDEERDVSYFRTFDDIVRVFQRTYPRLKKMNQDLLWLHVLDSTVAYAKHVVEGVLPNTPETEEAVFQLILTGLSEYLRP